MLTDQAHIVQSKDRLHKKTDQSLVLLVFF